MKRQEGDKNQKFIQFITSEFNFLIDEFGFTLTQTDQHLHGVFIRYKNNLTGIQISLVPQDGGVFVDVYRLVNNQFKDNPINIKRDSILNKYDLESVLALRQPDMRIERPPIDKLVYESGYEDVLNRVLHQFAQALRNHGPDFFQGNSELFVELERRVKSRIM